jgi:hypothetical protein
VSGWLRYEGVHRWVDGIVREYVSSPAEIEKQT